MGGASLPRRSQQWSNPQSPSILAELLADDRNSEARHKLIIETAKREHDRVRQEAERVYQLHIKKEEQLQLQEAQRKEEERIKLEEAIAAERLRVQALAAKKVEIPPTPALPEPAKPLPTSTTTAVAVPPSINSTPPKAAGVNGDLQALVPVTAKPSTSISNLFGGPKPIVSPLTTALPALKQPNGIPAGFNPFAKSPGTNGAKPQALITTAPTLTAPAAGDRIPLLDRYVIIHKNLKDLRKSIADQSTTSRALKARVGDMRRELRKKLGQLSVGGEPGANRSQLQSILATLKEGLANEVGSTLIDPNNFLVEPRAPIPGTPGNDMLPSVFLYLLNMLCKGAIGQFIREAGPRPQTADPVGIILASVFSDPAFQWRGASLIDILMAKFGVLCPVLFGRNGRDSDARAKLSLGWWRTGKGGPLVPEQVHFDRMTGLGSGFAAISLRKFGKNTKTNPYPPAKYWAAMSKIVNTPSDKISATQCMVLKAMIENYEVKFIEFYGSAAIAALRLCLVDFPARAPEKSAAVNSLTVLGQVMKKNLGLDL